MKKYIDRLVFGFIAILTAFLLLNYFYLAPRAKEMERNKLIQFQDMLNQLCIDTIGQDVVNQNISLPVWAYAMHDIEPLFPLNLDQNVKEDLSWFNGIASKWLLNENSNTPLYKAKTVACARRADIVQNYCENTVYAETILLQHQVVVHLVDIESGVVLAKGKLFSGGSPGNCPTSVTLNSDGSIPDYLREPHTDYGNSMIDRDALNIWINEITSK